jgi:hypothetical protein
MGMFDQAARSTVKLDPPGFFRWLFKNNDGPMTFREWLDTRRLRLPGEPDLTGDAVADFDTTEPGGRFALVLEAQTEPRNDIIEQLSLYAIALRMELRRVGGGKAYSVGAAVINLTGTKSELSLDMPIPGVADHGLFLRPMQRDLCEEDAAALLAEIAAGRATRALLPWIPLMRGGALPDIIAEWKVLAAAEPDGPLRSAYAVLALTFAELTRGLVEWQKGLEGWNMRESQTILGFKREGKEEGRLEMRREAILELLQIRFLQVPQDIQAAVNGTNDFDTLRRWFQSAASLTSLDDFRVAMK